MLRRLDIFRQHQQRLTYPSGVGRVNSEETLSASARTGGQQFTVGRLAAPEVGVPKIGELQVGARPCAGRTVTGGAAQSNHPGGPKTTCRCTASAACCLATLVLNKATVPTNPNYTFNLLTKPTPL